MVHRAAGWHCAIAYILWNHSSLRVSRRTDARPFRVYGVVRCRTVFFRHHEWSIANDWVKTHRRDRFDHRASGFIGLFLGSRRLGRAWRSRGSLWRSRRGAPRSLMSRWSRLTAQREAGAPDAKGSCAVQSTMYVSARTRKSVRARMRWGSAARPVRGQTLHLLATEFHMGKTGKKLIAKVEVGSAAVLPDSSPHERPDIVPTLQRAIFNSANFSSIATDAKGVIQIFNVGAERMLGYTAAEVTNKITPADISDPLEVIARARALSHELETPIAPGFEALVFKASRGIEDIYALTYIRKDGSRFPAVVSVTALRDAQDAIIGYLLIGTEVKAGALQSAIFNSANFSSIATDAKGVIQIFNVGAERMLGYAASEVMNKITPADISDPQEVVARAAALSVELGTPITPGFEALVFKASRGIEDIYELTYIRKDGSRFPAVVSVTALRDDLGSIIGYLLIGTDNTARKQAEEALLKAGALQSAIFNSANFSSIATDANGVIQIFNVGAERMLGYTAAEVMNKITPADISDPQEVIGRAKALSVELGTPITPGFEALVFKASRGIEDIYELTYFRKDGSRFPAVVSVTALRDAQNAIIGYLLIGTELKAGALQSAIFNSANFSSIATDAKGVIQIFNVGAERMLGYTAAEVMNKITPAEISDPQELIARAKALSVELGTT